MAWEFHFINTQEQLTKKTGTEMHFDTMNKVILNEKKKRCLRLAGPQPTIRFHLKRLR